MDSKKVLIIDDAVAKSKALAAVSNKAPKLQIKPTSDQIDKKKYLEMLVLEYKLINIGRSRLTRDKRQAVIWEVEKHFNAGDIQEHQIVCK